MLSGYSVNFEDVLLTVQNDELITYDIENVRIYDKKGEEATSNFNITNVYDGYLSSRMIKIV